MFNGRFHNRLDIGQRFQGEQLLCRRLYKSLLNLRPADIAGGITGAVADYTNGLITGQRLLAGIEIDIQVLGRVGIVHSLRHVKGDTAHKVDNFHKGFQIHFHIAVHLEAQHGGQHLTQRFNALVPTASAAVDGVNLGNRIITVNQRITGNAHQRHGMLHGIHMRNHNGIGQETALVGTHHQNVIDTIHQTARCFKLGFHLFPIVIDIGKGRLLLSLVLGKAGALIGTRPLRRLDHRFGHTNNHSHQHHQRNTQQNQSPLGTVEPVRLARSARCIRFLLRLGRSMRSGRLLLCLGRRWAALGSPLAARLFGCVFSSEKLHSFVLSLCK